MAHSSNPSDAGLPDPDESHKINWSDLPKEVRDWIVEHPYQSAFHVVNGVVFFYPSLLTGPCLWALGWGATGPRAGSAAAALMSKLGIVQGGSWYAHLQSAAMGGYGAAAVQGVARIGTVVVGATERLSSWWYGSKPSEGGDGNSGGETPKHATGMDG